MADGGVEFFKFLHYFFISSMDGRFDVAHFFHPKDIFGMKEVEKADALFFGFQRGRERHDVQLVYFADGELRVGVE